MDDELLKEIEKAISVGTPLIVKYNGGSRPGTTRSIIPTKISGDRLFAFCEESGSNKSFILSKMELANNEERNYAEYVNISELVNLDEVVQSHLEQWTNLGWHVEYDRDYISLFSKFKNVKIFKHPSVGICFEEYKYAYTEWDGDGNEINQFEKAERPWMVFGKGRQTVTYKDISKAIDRFIEYSLNALTPNQS